MDTIMMIEAARGMALHMIGAVGVCLAVAAVVGILAALRIR